MTRVCPLFSLALLVIGCGDVVKDPSQVPDGAVTPIDSAPDAPAQIRSVRVDTPPTVGGQSISSSPLPLTAGNTVIAVAYWSDSTHHVAISNSAAAFTWKSIARQSVAQGCGPGTNLQMFYATIPSSGTVTVTATQPEGPGNMGLFVVEYSGLAADPLDGSAGMPAGRVSSVMTAGALTTTSFDVLVAAFHDSAGSGTMVPGPGFAVVGLDTTSYAMVADQQASPGSYEATARLPGTTMDACWVASVLALRAR
ncbi:MAG TPA: hypothetical protein VLM79_30210 [Kofleriaceae bacterium]|nr:hypothetical protein [Kofleriaceae bacterium]